MINSETGFAWYCTGCMNHWKTKYHVWYVKNTVTTATNVIVIIIVVEKFAPQIRYCSMLWNESK
jgi:hypothetical protein